MADLAALMAARVAEGGVGQGGAPPLLVDLVATLPIVTAPLAEAKAGAGRATVLCNLALMQARGLTREMTGQGRYRVWTARLWGDGVFLAIPAGFAGSAKGGAGTKSCGGTGRRTCARRPVPS